MQTDIETPRAYLTTKQYLFQTTLPPPTLSVSVIVPVRNEAHHLVQTLDALRNQYQADGKPLPANTFEVLLLANNCTDLSYEVAQQYQQRYPSFALRIAQIQLPDKKANIGYVRRLLMDEAYRRLMSINNPVGIIASTDGDSVVDRHWIYFTQQEIASGIDAVGGRILTHPEQSHTRLYHLRDVTYRTLIAQAEAVLDPSPHDPWPRHFQHFGASIAVTCQMYQQAGGLPERPFLEDEAFYRALLRTDAKVRKSPQVKVFTSTRTQGRVAVGFSEQLRHWAGMAQSSHCQFAEPAEAVIIRLRNRQRLRQCWHQQHADETALRAIATGLMIHSSWLARELRASSYFGQLWEKVEEKMATGPWTNRWPSVPITTAIQALRAFLNAYSSA